MLTVCCVFTSGPYPYTADYVIRLERMVRRHLSREYMFVCLTDRWRELPHPSEDWIEWISESSLKGIVPDNGAGYWQKVKLFDPAIQKLFPRGRVLYLDLDTLIVSSLDPIVDFPADFALTEDAFIVDRAHLTTDRFGRRLVRRFNSSVMVWNAGEQTDMWTRWSPAVAQRLSTDQDWIGEQSEHAVAMPLAWFPRISQVQPPWPEAAKVVLVKKPKNHIAAAQWPWFDAQWGGAAA